MSSDDEIDDASMKSMRAVWLSMRDEEPPAAGMSALLAAAAAKADEMRAPSFWERAFAFLRRPPALAFATVLILIGGAVLVTRTVNDKVDSMTTDEKAPVNKEAAPAKPAELRVPAVEPKIDEPPIEEPTRLPPIEHGAEQGLDQATPPPPPPPPPRHRETKPQAHSTSKGKAGEAGPKAEQPKLETATGDHSKDLELRNGFSRSENLPATDPVTTSIGGGGTPPAPPPEAPPQKTQSQKPTAVTDDAMLDERDTGKKPGPTVEQLEEQAKSAARRNDCPAVRVIAGQIKKQDKSFYESRVLKDPTIARCL